ncbi:hypothetical protein CLAFUW4_00867 [Fulvia fulva]|uniref:C2H2-type domain-containing protein n=1 Tax=Passalora fulva TaxID=5499 RepID=A0A9Q8L716_PASFU|nr:uncharacterized protein CLAFUR5_00870 [Fulvia fulva]KAK4634259.1 hypothetical protein CLAFUR4_00868 [Fulvia fulva]KAK4636709.1 hypothetical protein CLAFUR0_00868 [Fulvia fulva]UJO12033.1 hypothetical protein CLAFUR5_00870 [Fulvia fulva]WPV10018.1 hypothetical protein CLAFUW4_00867 [Fulvia fulva]WPV23614.1 hypothetical protein CLAFUW7_00949 [Fulvia fulva]
MAQDGNYGFALSPDQGFQNYHGIPSDVYGNGQSQQMHHRASDPLDLSQFHRYANSASDLPLHNLTKPAHDTAWNSESMVQLSHFIPPIWNGMSKPGARTEPIPYQDVYRQSPLKSSEVSDSAYESMPTSGGAQEVYTTGNNALARDYFTSDLKPISTGLPSKANPSRSVKSEGQFLIARNNSRRKQYIGPCRFPGCKKQPKNQSDAKYVEPACTRGLLPRKHALTHSKPHQCREPECSRKDGFATVNDLERHKKSVHNMYPKVGNPAGFMCAACPIVEGVLRKFWPRRDNFKAHIRRKHSTYNEEQLLEMSKQINRPDDAQTADGLSVYEAALRSARQSQIDPMEGHIHQHLSPILGHLIAEHNDGTVFPPDSAIESQGDPIAFAGGHMDDTLLFGGQQYNLSPMQLNVSTFPFPPPAEGHPTPIQRDFARPQEQHQMLPSIQVTTSSLSEPQSASATSTSQSAGGASSAQGHFPCTECGKIKTRECDLRKHMKRHTRPYGCTFPSCTKRFGSRNDWKRHESSQHYLTDMWKCPLGCSRRPYLHVSLLEEHFRSPLHNVHDPDRVKTLCEQGRLGREGHHHFWCGFCKRLIKQERGGMLQQVGNAWDARFKHIGDHFDKDCLDSGDWVCVEENRPKWCTTGYEKGSGTKRGSVGGKAEEEEEGGLPDVRLEEGGSNGRMMGHVWDAAKKRKLENFGEDADADGESDDEMYR